MPVFLFDIDGTLIDTGGAGGAALRSAFSKRFAVDNPAEVSFSGRTDLAIARDLFQAHAIDDNQPNWLTLRQDYLAELRYFLPRRSGQVLPGASEMLAALSRDVGNVLGLLTGNVREGARLKLEYYSLQHFFSFGGFGDEDYDRNQVARRALEAALAHTGGAPAADTVWVIGDTPFDILCGRSIRAKTLAVATGVHDRTELASHEPDVLLDDLSRTDDVLRALQS